MKLKTKEEIVSRLLEIAYEQGKFPFKKDICKYQELPSYNSILRLGISFIELSSMYKLEEYSNNVTLCLCCGKELEFKKRNNKFCSRKCSKKWNDSIGIKTNEKKNKDPVEIKSKYLRKEDECLWCSKYIGTGWRQRSVFCSFECNTAQKVFDGISAWSDGISSPDIKTLYRYLVYIDGNFCSVCGLNLWNGKEIRLEVEHIDGDSSNNCPSNLCLICPNCHSQTDTYKGKNKGNGRFSRINRYHEGKSY